MSTPAETFTPQARYDAFCASSCLAFRYVADPSAQWRPGLAPVYPDGAATAGIPVRTTDDVERELRRLVARVSGEGTGILLSAGMDSAILASFLPAGTPAFTIDFEARQGARESETARLYAAAYDLDHHLVQVTWPDYLETMDLLIRRKRAPLHAVEPALYKAARIAAAMGVRTLIVGNGADSTFGGLDKLLSKDWSFDDFVRRYTFVDPAIALAAPSDISGVYEPYRTIAGIDVIGFLKEVHGAGVIQAFENAITAAGCESAQPFEELRLDAPLDLSRIRNGESKYVLRALFQRRYPGLETPPKIAFARPMDEWLAGWRGPRRPEFSAGLDVALLTGEQRWLVFCLERFMDLMEHDPGAAL